MFEIRPKTICDLPSIEITAHVILYTETTDTNYSLAWNRYDSKNIGTVAYQKLCVLAVVNQEAVQLRLSIN